MGKSRLVTLTALSLGVCAYAIAVYGLLAPGPTLPPEMRATFETQRAALSSHIFASMLALALGPFQFSARLRSAHTRVHRWLGRLYLGIGVSVGGVAGLFMAFHAYGGWVARAGFACLAILWLYTGLRAYRAIRARDVLNHRRWMVRNFALTFGAVTLRLWLPALMLSGASFETAYRIVAWLSWVPNVLLADLLSQRRRDLSAPSSASATLGAR